MARLITWFDVDDDLARTDWTPRAWLSVCVFAGFFNVGLSIIGARHYDANWRVIWAVYVAYVIVYALNTFVVGIDRLITSHRWCIVAGLPFSLAMTSVYGAAARDPASAAYGALFVGAIMIARSTRGWAVALAIVVVNVVLRVWAHPAAPVSTLLLTTTIALAAAAIFLLASQPTAELLRTQVAIDAAHALTTIASERAAALTVAMSLHDGLSGILYAAKRRAKDASLDEARTIARSVLAEARRVLGSAPSRYDDDAIAGGLVQAARGLGVDAEVRVRGRAGAEEGEIREAVAIATELVGNVAKHGAGRVSIDVDLRIARVQGKSEDRGPWGPRGRGLRNIELRAQARGGTMSIDRRHGLVIVTCAWPPRGIADVRWWRRSPMLVECSAIFIAVTPLLFHGRPLTGIVTTALALAYAGHNVHTRERTVTNRRMELLRALEARHAMEQADILALVERGCAAAVDALSHASAGEDAREIERAITTLAECVSDLLWALESDATPDETAAELHELARARGTIFSGAPLHTPHDRFAARRQLRVIVAAEPIRSEGSAASRWR